MITITHAPRSTPIWVWANVAIQEFHYLRRIPDPRTSAETFIAYLDGHHVGALIFGRPEATRCTDWYGSVGDAESGACEVTRWQVLNLARVWIDPNYQAGGPRCRRDIVPGYTDRRGNFVSTLASDILRAAIHVIGYQYLRLRPPCFLDEPYQINWLMSYCNTALHRGVIYAAAGFDLYRTNPQGIQTWRIPLPSLTPAEDADIRMVATLHPRSQSYRAQRQQLAFSWREDPT